MDDRPLSDGFSPDGYIRDQDCFSSVRYRGMPASINGCGWIAAYNLFRFLGRAEPWDTVRRELDDLHRIRMPGPTLLPVMRGYLLSRVPQLREFRGREAALEAAGRSRAGIFRYREDHVPHFVSYIRQEDGSFRFFNMADDLEDCVMTMEEFIQEHAATGTVIVLTVQ